MIVPASPYPGFSWSLTQHTGPGANPVVLFNLLKSAYRHSCDEDYQDKITEELNNQGLLTPNIRRDQGKAQLWRDYQQVLSELGLIVSTKFTTTIEVTPIGLLWLDGQIGYSELLATQCFNYQYPNGHKQDISPKQSALLTEAGLQRPRTRTELDVRYGVLIKPAALILRVLCEGAQTDTFRDLSAAECSAFLVPVKTFDGWRRGYDCLLENKKQNISIKDPRRLRHVQEWFRLLSLTDVFALNNGRLSLSKQSSHMVPELALKAEFLSAPSLFWIPRNFDKHFLGTSWFDYFGNPDISKQWLCSEDQLDPEYVAANYPEGVEGADYKEFNTKSWNASLNLSEVTPDKYIRKQLELFIPKINDENIRLGHIARQQKTLLHDRIVGAVAKKYKDRGWDTYEDKNSVDLLAIKDNSHVIVEVKTVTSRNLSHRLRLGIGQLSEYRYRSARYAKVRPSTALVLSNKANFPDWMVDFFSSEMDMELFSLDKKDSFYSYTNGRNKEILL